MIITATYRTVKQQQELVKKWKRSQKGYSQHVNSVPALEGKVKEIKE